MVGEFGPRLSFSLSLSTMLNRTKVSERIRILMTCFPIRLLLLFVFDCSKIQYIKHMPSQCNATLKAQHSFVHTHTHTLDSITISVFWPKHHTDRPTTHWTCTFRNVSVYIKSMGFYFGRPNWANECSCNVAPFSMQPIFNIELLPPCIVIVFIFGISNQQQ